MNTALTYTEFAALSPYLILMSGAFILLLCETFMEEKSKVLAFPFTLLTFLLAGYATSISPTTQHPLINNWIAFDDFSLLLNRFFIGIGMASACLAFAFFKRFQASQAEYDTLLLFATLGLMLIGASNDFLTLFLGLETLSISLYVLCGYMKSWKISKESAVKYFLNGAVASCFLLYGIALVYGAVGFTHFDGLLVAYQHITTQTERALFLGGIAFISVGLAFKAAIFPFHFWAPDVYQGSSTPVTAFMAVGTKVGAFAAFARLFLIVLPHFDVMWNDMMTILAILTLVYGNLLALRQEQLRRFFAYSGISHAGFLLIPIIAATPESLSALMFYLLVYACATMGAFAILTVLDQDAEGVFLKDLQGLFQRSPFLASAFALCLLTLVGIPPTAGFFAKFYVFKIAFQSGHYVLVVVGLAVTVLSVFYYMRLISIMFFKEAGSASKIPHVWWAKAIGSVSCLLILVGSLYPELFMKLLFLDQK